MRISDWSSDVCSSDLPEGDLQYLQRQQPKGVDRWLRAFPQTLQRLALVIGKAVEIPGRGDQGQAERRRKYGGCDGHGAAKTIADQVIGCSQRSEEHTSELQSLMRISYAVFCLTKKKHKPHSKEHNT